MNLEIVRKLSENRGGGLKKLAADVGMSDKSNIDALETIRFKRQT